jgi:hypothetical protein
MDDRRYSADTYATLRNVRLLNEGTIDGKRFVRCIPIRASVFRDLTDADRRAIALTAAQEINDPGVVVAHNPEFGGDYLRVETNTATFRLICHMKS